MPKEGSYREKLGFRCFPMTQNFVAPARKLDRVRRNIRNDSETSLATWQWRAKVPLDRERKLPMMCGEETH
jgi:hypothetical protein